MAITSLTRSTQFLKIFNLIAYMLLLKEFLNLFPTFATISFILFKSLDYLNPPLIQSPCRKLPVSKKKLMAMRCWNKRKPK